MTKRPLVAAIAIAVLPLTAPAPAHATGERVTYTVESDGPLLSVSYYNAMDDMVTEADLPVPVQWSKSFIWQVTYQFASLSAQTSGTQVTCQVAVNGQLRDRKSATGRYAMVQCAAPRRHAWWD